MRLGEEIYIRQLMFQIPTPSSTHAETHFSACHPRSYHLRLLLPRVLSVMGKQGLLPIPMGGFSTSTPKAAEGWPCFTQSIAESGLKIELARWG